MPLISVIMPVYNAEDYLSFAIESVLSQTLEDFELILIDDCSTDKSLEIIKSFAEKDHRIVVVKNTENLKLIKSLNKGIQLSRARYIARMDADDICLPDRFRKQVDVLNKRLDVGLVGTDMYQFYQGSENLFLHHEPCQEDRQLAWEILRHTVLYHPTVMMRSSLFIDQKFKYSEEAHLVEDYELWLRLIQKTKIYIIPEPLLVYRRHRLSESQKNKNAQLESACALTRAYIEARYGEDFSLDFIRVLKSYSKLNLVSSIKEFEKDCERFFEIARSNRFEKEFSKWLVVVFLYSLIVQKRYLKIKFQIKCLIPAIRDVVVLLRRRYFTSKKLKKVLSRTTR